MPCAPDTPCGGILYEDLASLRDMAYYQFPQRRWTCLNGHSFMSHVTTDPPPKSSATPAGYTQRKGPRLRNNMARVNKRARVRACRWCETTPALPKRMFCRTCLDPKMRWTRWRLRVSPEQMKELRKIPWFSRTRTQNGHTRPVG